MFYFAAECSLSTLSLPPHVGRFLSLIGMLGAVARGICQ